MRISDWSQTCALPISIRTQCVAGVQGKRQTGGEQHCVLEQELCGRSHEGKAEPVLPQRHAEAEAERDERGRHSHQTAEQPRPIDRKSDVEGKRVSVRVDPGGRRIIKKKKNITLKTKQEHKIT